MHGVKLLANSCVYTRFDVLFLLFIVSKNRNGRRGLGSLIKLVLKWVEVQQTDVTNCSYY